MQRTLRIRLAFACLGLAALAGTLRAQGIDAALLEEIRRGPAQIELKETVVSVPIVGSRTLPLLEVAINGRGPFRLLVDFGSNVILLDDSVARKSGARMLVDRERKDIMRVQSMTVGKASFRDVVVGAAGNLDVDGVLGFNFFRDLLVTIDFPRMTLELGRGRLPEPDGREILSFEVEERMPFLPVAVGGDKTVPVNFDTGASGWLVVPLDEKDVWRLRSPPVPGPTTWNNQTGWTRVQIARSAEDLRFGRHTVVTPRIEIDPAASFTFFGCSLLQRFVLTFDIPSKRVRMRGPGEPIQVPGYRTFGIRLGRSGDAWQISDVIPNSRAAELGIRPDDVVVAVDGIPSKGLTKKSWNTIQQGRRKISIELSRAGRRRIYDLPLEVLG